jgi:hypothetical protein
MLSNFMGYVFDRCMGNFTEGQKERMRVAIVNSRTELILSKGCLPVGLDELTLKDQLTIGPNPTNGEVIIQSKKALDDELILEVFNLNGKLLNVKTKRQQNGYAINMRNYSSGVYFLKLSNQKESFTKKLILQTH